MNLLCCLLVAVRGSNDEGGALCSLMPMLCTGVGMGIPAGVDMAAAAAAKAAAASAASARTKKHEELLQMRGRVATLKADAAAAVLGTERSTEVAAAQAAAAHLAELEAAASAAAAAAASAAASASAVAEAASAPVVVGREKDTFTTPRPTMAPHAQGSLQQLLPGGTASAGGLSGRAMQRRRQRRQRRRPRSQQWYDEPGAADSGVCWGLRFVGLPRDAALAGAGGLGRDGSAVLRLVAGSGRAKRVLLQGGAVLASRFVLPRYSSAGGGLQLYWLPGAKAGVGNWVVSSVVYKGPFLLHSVDVHLGGYGHGGGGGGSGGGGSGGHGGGGAHAGKVASLLPVPQNAPAGGWVVYWSRRFSGGGDTERVPAARCECVRAPTAAPTPSPTPPTPAPASTPPLAPPPTSTPTPAPPTPSPTPVTAPAGCELVRVRVAPAKAAKAATAKAAMLRGCGGRYEWDRGRAGVGGRAVYVGAEAGNAPCRIEYLAHVPGLGRQRGWVIAQSSVAAPAVAAPAAPAAAAPVLLQVGTAFLLADVASGTWRQWRRGAAAAGEAAPVAVQCLAGTVRPPASASLPQVVAAPAVATPAAATPPGSLHSSLHAAHGTATHVVLRSSNSVSRRRSSGGSSAQSGAAAAVAAGHWLAAHTLLALCAVVVGLPLAVVGGRRLACGKAAGGARRLYFGEASPLGQAAAGGGGGASALGKPNDGEMAAALRAWQPHSTRLAGSQYGLSSLEVPAQPDQF